MENLKLDVINLYKEFHKIPEYGDRLPLTKKLVCDTLEKIGVTYTCFSGHDCVIAEIEGVLPGKTVGYRADMDALRIKEETNLDFASTREGFMHACGHDAHTAIALCAAERIFNDKKSLHGKIRFLFEAGEETSNGAIHLLEENALEDVDAVFGLHIGTLAGKEVDSGKFVVLSDAVTAGKDAFKIEITGKGGHGAYPYETIDPIRISAGVITAIQSIVSMEIPSGNGAVITFGSIAGGKDNNSVPEKVVLQGTVRTQDEEIRRYISKRINEIAESIPLAFGGKGVCEIKRGSNCVLNNRRLTEIVADTLAEKFGEDRVIRSMSKALMGSDDFARLSEKVPGVYFFLSSSNEKIHTDTAHHNQKFMIDESVLPDAVKGVVAILENAKY